MKKLLVIVLLTLAVPCLAFGQAAQKAAPAKTQTAEQEVSALEHGWVDAALKYDVAWFERHLASTLTMIDEKGEVTDKAKNVANVKDRATTYESVSIEGLRVQVYGNAAVATGIWVAKGATKGKPFNESFPFTDTWVKRGAQWQCVASHNSILPKK